MLSALSPRLSYIAVTLEDFSYMNVGINSDSINLTFHLTLSEVERDHIIKTLMRCEWRCKTAAKLLGIDRSTLYRKMKKYGISKT